MKQDEDSTFSFILSWNEFHPLVNYLEGKLKSNDNPQDLMEQIFHEKPQYENHIKYMTGWITANAGNFDMIKWLYENNFYYDESACEAAAYGDHFEILKWLHEHNCPWDEQTCSSAVEGGHFEILKYAVENGCKS